jgi:hypothetical protein
MDMVEEILSDDAISVSNGSKQTVASTDLSELLKYQGNPSASYRSTSTRNNAYHERKPCSASMLRVPTIDTQEHDLLDEFFNTVQNHVCKEAKGQRLMASRIPSSPQSLFSSGSVKYEKDVIDIVFENVENATCNKPSVPKSARPFIKTSKRSPNDAQEKIKELGKLVHLKMYKNDPENIRERVDEWLTDTFQGNTSSLDQCPDDVDAIEAEREKSFDFMDVFFQRFQHVACDKLSFDKPATSDKSQGEQDQLEPIESVFYKSEDFATAFPVKKSEGSSDRNPYPSALPLSPASAASTPRSLDGESTTYESVVTESEYSHSGSERTEASEHSISPRTDASYREHIRRIINPSEYDSHKEDRDKKTQPMSASSIREGNGVNGNESVAFEVGNRPLFVIKEEVSVTESMISEKRQNEMFLQKRMESASDPQRLPPSSDFRRSPPKRYSFRYSSAYLKFERKACAPEAAVHTAQDWLKQFKHTLEATMYRLTAAFSGMDSDGFCSPEGNDSPKQQDFQMDPKRKVNEVTAEPIRFDKVDERANTANISYMCNGRVAVDLRDGMDQVEDEFSSAIQNSSIFGLLERSQFPSASLMTSLDEDEDDGDSHQSFDTRYATFRDVPRRQQEPPEQKESSTNVQVVRRNINHARDPEPSFQLKFDSDTTVGRVSNHLEKPSPEEIKTPRSSETEKTALLTATTFSAVTDEEDENDIHAANKGNKAPQKTVSNGIEYPQDRQRPNHQPVTKSSWFHKSQAFVSEKQTKPETAGRDSSVPSYNENTFNFLTSARTSKESALSNVRQARSGIESRDSSGHSSKETELYHAKVFSIFEEDEGTTVTQENVESSCSYPSEMDIQHTCTDIVVYEEKPDFIRLWLGKDGKHPISPWQLVLYVAWLSVSFLLRVNGEVNSCLAEKKRSLQAILEDEEQCYALSRDFSLDSLDAVPIITLQLSLE